jgi:dienelactone hydrolase
MRTEEVTMKSFLAAAVALVALSVCAITEAAIRAETVEYKHGDVVLQGYLAYDDSVVGKRPGVLVVHEWWGINPYIKRRVEQLAKLGYVAFAADIYGKGMRASTPEEAGKLAGIYRTDRKLLRERATASLEVLTKHELTDMQKIAAIGYCFGGTTVLELARSGSGIAGAVSFHGGLDTPTPEEGKKIKAKVLALHGADDPFVPSEQVAAFQDEMRKGGVDWQMVFYGGALHSFTNPDVDSYNLKGAAYNKKADERSWNAMKVFFAEIFR